MNQTVPIAAPRPIDLKLVPDFNLGGMDIRPGACEVAHAHGTSRLQHRVMQVLVALAQAAGQPVSREVLRERCWGGQVVGEDSIGRCIQSLRRLAACETPPLFRLETIPRIGYRLTAVSDPCAGRDQGTAGGELRRRAWVVLALGAAVVTVAGLVGLQRMSAQPHWRVASFERFAPELANTGSPAISPDGRLIAFTAGAANSGDRHIFLSLLSHGDPIQLTHGPGSETAPAWSLDGGRLAFVSQRAGQPCRLLVMPSLGGVAREVGRCAFAGGTSVAWTPAGDGLFFADSSETGGPTRIFRLDLATGARQPITQPASGQIDGRARLSPDGRRIAFVRNVNKLTANIWTHDLASGAERLVGPGKGDVAGFAWAQDSRSIFIVGGPGRESEIWSYPLDRGDPSFVGATPLELARIATARGGWLAAEATSVHDEVMEPGARGWPIVVDAGPGQTLAFAYARDGTLALASDRSGENAIWVKAPGQRARALARFGTASVGGLAWSPAGERLAFVWAKGGTRVLRVIDRQGAALAAAPLAGTAAGWPTWSGDGRSILCPISDQRGWRIWRLPLRRRDAPVPVSGYGWANVAAHGNAIYGSRSDRPGIWRLGTPPRLIAPGFEPSLDNDWTIFKDLIVFSAANRNQILTAPLSGGPARVVAQTSSGDDLSDLAVDPASGAVAYRTVVEEGSGIELFHLARR